MESTLVHRHDAWNKGKLVGQESPFKLKETGAILRRHPSRSLISGNQLDGCRSNST
jgi:hypothetical protein